MRRLIKPNKDIHYHSVVLVEEVRMLITFEGPDGVGKDTIALETKKRLEADGHKVMVVPEPPKTRIGALIRAELLDSDRSYNSITQMLLMAAARADNLMEIILPAIEKGYIVISTRGTLSSLVYQGPGVRELLEDDGLPETVVSDYIYTTLSASQHILDAAKVTEKKILLTCPPSVSMERMNKRGVLDNFESVSIEVLTKRLQDYISYSAIEDYKIIPNIDDIQVTMGEVMKWIEN